MLKHGTSPGTVHYAEISFGSILNLSICMIQRRQVIYDTLHRNPASMSFIDVSVVKCLSIIQYVFK